MPTFTPEFLDDIRDRLRASDVIGRYVRLKKEGREFRGLSPFSKEKTPSFFVNDDKGRYFDFSSGKSGDIIGFLIDHENLTFPEAVTKLAEEAGLEIPRSPHDQQKAAAQAKVKKGLFEAHEEATQFFQQLLFQAEGRVALDYLRDRGVSPELITHFRLGFSPKDNDKLKKHLNLKGFTDKTLLEAGLLGKNDRGDVYDRFRDRVMFPIADQKNRIIAFGGRALEKTAKAKYLNSPETPIFYKGKQLYNYMPARKAASNSSQSDQDVDRSLIVVEGYMDVIGLASAGVYNAVAPLGTAFTENHLALLWRACDEPFLCFDGDRAGRGAAYRAIDRALPILKPGKSMRFAFLPDGQDPDDYVKNMGGGKAGGTAFRGVLKEAANLVDILWQRETEKNDQATPEKMAAFKGDLRKMVKQIADKDVRQAYGQVLAAKMAPPSNENAGSKPYKTSFNPFYQKGAKGQKGKFSKYNQPSGASEALKNIGKAQKMAKAQGRQREELLVYTLLHHPWVYVELEEKINDLELSHHDLSHLMQSIIRYINMPAGSRYLSDDLFLLKDEGALETRPMHDYLQNDAQNMRTMSILYRQTALRLNRFAAPLDLKAYQDHQAFTQSRIRAVKGWLNIWSLVLHHGVLKEESYDAAREAGDSENSAARWHALTAERFAVVNEIKDEVEEE